MISVDDNPHNDERIDFLNSFDYAAEEILQLLSEAYPVTDDDEGVLPEERPDDPYGLGLLVEEEMGCTFMDIFMQVHLIKDASMRVASRLLNEVAKEKGIVYLIGSEKGKILKIGYTNRDLKIRLQELQSGSAYKLEVIKVRGGTRETEKQELRRAKAFRIQGEWFTWDQSIIDGFGDFEQVRAASWANFQKAKILNETISKIQ